MSISDDINNVKQATDSKQAIDSKKAKRSAAAKRAAATRKANKAKQAKQAKQPAKITVDAPVTSGSTVVYQGFTWSVAYAPSNGYKGIPRAVFSALTIAGYCTLGMATFTGTTVNAGKPVATLGALKQLTSVTAVNYFKRQGWLVADDNGYKLSANGLNRLNDRLANVTDTYGVSGPIVNAAIEAMRNGGHVEVDGTIVRFDQQVRLSIIK